MGCASSIPTAAASNSRPTSPPALRRTCRAVPRKLAHVVVNTPDIDRATTFYSEVLGLRISDWSEHVMSFLRCDSEHHALAFNAAPHASLNHCSWTMGSIDDLFRAQGRIRAGDRR